MGDAVDIRHLNRFNKVYRGLDLLPGPELARAA